MNTIAHAQLRSGAADLHVGGTLLSMHVWLRSVLIPGISVATYLAFVTWCLVKVVVEPWIEADCVGYAFSV